MHVHKVVFSTTCSETYNSLLSRSLRRYNPKWPDYAVTNFGSPKHNPAPPPCRRARTGAESLKDTYPLPQPSGPSNVARHSCVNITDEKSVFMYFPPIQSFCPCVVV